jgi:SulP family sulfate permease
MLNTFTTSTLLKNSIPGITVALVSIPLSIAIAIASGGTPEQGIITGFFATIVAALFGGSKYNIIGPAGALTTILFAASHIGAFENGYLLLPVIAIMSGFILLLFYVFKLHTYISYIPDVVVHGFAGGVALVIASSQLKDAFGLSKAYSSTGEFLHDMAKLFTHVGSMEVLTVALFAVFLVSLLLWKKYVPKIPGVLPASVVGVIVGMVLESGPLGQKVLSIGDKFGEISLSFTSLIPVKEVSVLLSNSGVLLGVIKVSVIVAVIALLETLITAKIADTMTSTTHSSKKETLGLSLANIVSGLFSGLPATGVFIRTGLNVRSGATHYASALIAGVGTGLGALLVIPFFGAVPLAVISAMLIMTALGLIDMAHFKHLFKHSRKEFVVGMVTIFFVLVFDPLYAVCIGTALYYVLKRRSKKTQESVQNEF